MGWFNNWIEKHFKQHGYKQVQCDKYGAVYVKYNKNDNYNSVISILHKNNGNHLVQCYDENIITASVDGKPVFVNSGDGISTSLLFWIWLKYKWLFHKYNWKRMQNYYDS